MPQVPPRSTFDSFWKDEEPSIRLMLMHSHLPASSSLRKILESDSQIEIIAEGAFAKGLLTQAEQPAGKPDIILIDLPADYRQARQLLESLPEFMAFTRGSRVLLLTEITEAEMLYRALRLGVMGILEKDRCVEALREAVHSVHFGRAWFDRVMMARVFTELASAGGRIVEETDPPAGSRSAEFSGHERELISLIGRSNKGIISDVRAGWHLN